MAWGGAHSGLELPRKTPAAFYQLGVDASTVGERVWVVPNASVIGRAELGVTASGSFGAVLRGDHSVSGCAN